MNQYSKLFAAMFVFIALSGCQTTDTKVQLAIDPYTAFHDDVFPGLQNIKIETEQQIFALDPQAQAFVEDRMAGKESAVDRIQSLIKGIFNHTELDLLYDNDANTIASETFANHAANCLSLTIMTFAMADYANLAVRFQEVEIPEYWERKGGYSLLNGHVNLRIMATEKNEIVYSRTRSFELDFDRRARPMRLPTTAIDKQRVLAMFYNNKGVDELINKQYAQAYAYLRQALIKDASFAPAWANLGLLYRLNNHLEYAEQHYIQALAIKPEDATTLENLAFLYSITHRNDQANEIITQINLNRLKNPNYHYMLGEEAYEKGEFQLAIEHFRQAVRLDDEQHTFYFGLAKSYFNLNDKKNSEKYLKLAKRHAWDPAGETIYQNKLNRLTGL